MPHEEHIYHTQQRYGYIRYYVGNSQPQNSFIHILTKVRLLYNIYKYEKKIIVDETYLLYLCPHHFLQKNNCRNKQNIDYNPSMNSYFYIDSTSKQQLGPFTPNELQAKNIQPDTVVWCSGMPDWIEARNVAELAFIFNSGTPPPPVSPQVKRFQSTNSTNQGQSMYNNNVYGRNDVRPMPKNWLIESILVTIFCCQVFGIIAIVYSTKVESLYHAGDYEAAEEASRNAKKWVTFGFFSLFIILALYFLFFVVIGATSAIFG